MQSVSTSDAAAVAPGAVVAEAVPASSAAARARRSLLRANRVRIVSLIVALGAWELYGRGQNAAVFTYPSAIFACPQPLAEAVN